MNDLEKIINDGWEIKDKIKPDTDKNLNDAIKEMIEGLSNADLNDRKFISRAMYEIRNPEFTKALKEAKGQDRSPEVNRNIAAAIERHESSDKARKSDALWKKSAKELYFLLKPSPFSALTLTFFSEVPVPSAPPSPLHIACCTILL